jgi:hypothetical protein
MRRLASPFGPFVLASEAEAFTEQISPILEQKDALKRFLTDRKACLIERRKVGVSQSRSISTHPSLIISMQISARGGIANFFVIEHTSWKMLAREGNLRTPLSSLTNTFLILYNRILERLSASGWDDEIKQLNWQSSMAMNKLPAFKQPKDLTDRSQCRGLSSVSD